MEGAEWATPVSEKEPETSWPVEHRRCNSWLYERGLHKVSKNLGPTSNLQAPGRWHRVLWRRPTNNRRHCTKLSLRGEVPPGIWAPLSYDTIIFRTANKPSASPEGYTVSCCGFIGDMTVQRSLMWWGVNIWKKKKNKTVAAYFNTKFRHLSEW
jgi:hypothetical protein